MTISFLLRFQERCEDSRSDAVATGTLTKTKIMREQPDADPTRAAFRSLPVVDIYPGTVTNTRIPKQQEDAGYGSSAGTLPCPTRDGDHNQNGGENGSRRPRPTPA